MTPKQKQRLINRIHPDFWKGISCGEGWDNIIISLDEKLSEIDPDYVVYQIKQKFGGLRYYANPSITLGDVEKEKFKELIREAEYKSISTCELTGKPGVLMIKNFYIKTLDPTTAPEGFVIFDDPER